MPKFICLLSKSTPGFGNVHKSVILDTENIETARKLVLSHGMNEDGGFSIGLWEPLVVAEPRTTYKWKRREGNEMLPVKL